MSRAGVAQARNARARWRRPTCDIAARNTIVEAARRHAIAHAVDHPARRIESTCGGRVT
jgi:hypothetical protein